jgi:hypothetical protein
MQEMGGKVACAWTDAGHMCCEGVRVTCDLLFIRGISIYMFPTALNSTRRDSSRRAYFFPFSINSTPVRTTPMAAPV